MDIIGKNPWIHALRYRLRFFRITGWSMSVASPLREGDTPADGGPPDWLVNTGKVEITIKLSGFFRKRQYGMPGVKDSKK